MLRRIDGGNVPNTIWPSDNPWGIPTLRLDRQGEVIDLPFQRWGRETRKSRMKGTWHFYTDDYKFTAIWGRPQVVINSACVGAVEPNWSVHQQTPPAVAVWQTYRKRWLGRFWQEEGVRIWVDLNVARDHREINLLGVPKGWKSFATRGSVQRLDEIEEEHGRARQIAGGDVTFLVYGGGAAVGELAQKRGWLYFGEERDVVARAPKKQQSLLRAV